MEIITHIDQVLPLIGEIGLFQILYICILCLITIPATFQTLIIYFVADNPGWHCVANSTTCTLKEPVITSTMTDLYKTRCSFLRSEWEYVEEDLYSVVTEFDLSCKREHLIYVSKSMFFAGMAVGAVAMGFLGDKYGRSKVMKPATIISLLIAFLSAFSPNFWVFAIGRFLLGLLAPGTVVMFFVVTSEMTGPRYRPLAGIILWFFFTIGLVILGLVAMSVPTWKMLMVYSTAPYFVLLIFIFFLPESLRWLYVNNQVQEATKLINKIARINGKPKPKIYLTPPKPLHDKVSPLLLFSSAEMCLKSLNIGFAWLVNGLVYYGVSLSAKDFTGNFHRDFILSSLVEFPAAVIAVLASMYLGRKRTTQIPMILGGLCCALVVAIDEKTEDKHLINVRLTLGLFGKFFITLAYDVIYTWTVELYPTQIRTEAMGFVQITSRLGAMLSPWVVDGLGTVKVWAPFVLMGVLSVLVGVFLHFLPETKDKKTAEFLENDVKQEQGKFGLPSSSSKRKKRPDAQKLSLVREEDEEDIEA
ncbi:solute carrier family 22 member 15-like [Clytia hemisphaerica]|uniref:Major facilitator superfamily (MFS) profile domain-containing protein n=1 Tax=Clytia hemisphaerica TaxID=252671 RepID=A0A7M6DIZ1_9CNID